MKTAAFYIAVCVLALRALVPAGYMPGALDNGWHLQICPEGLNGHERAVLMGTAGSGPGHHHDNHHDAAYLDCELGGASAEASAPAAFTAISNPPVHVVVATSSVQSAYGHLKTPRLTRAPPNSDLTDRQHV